MKRNQATTLVSLDVLRRPLAGRAARCAWVVWTLVAGSVWAEGADPAPVVDERPEAPLFTELEGVGFDFVHFNGMSGERYFVEMTGGGGALFDADGDGDLDLYLPQGEMLGQGKTVDDAVDPPRHQPPFADRLYRNDLVVEPDGRRVLRFTDVTAESGIGNTGYSLGVAAGDIDNDGDVDLYLTNFGDNHLLRNRGDGTFENVTAQAGVHDRRWSVAAVFFDYDRDGWLDLYVGNYVDFTIATHKGCIIATGAKDYCGPNAYDPEPDRLFRNRGDGTFEDVTKKAGLGAPGAGLGAVAVDVDNDGWLDLYVANDGAPNHLWLNQKDGTFLDDALFAGCAVNAEGAPEASMGVASGDVDGDGDEDLFIAHLALETNTLYLNDGQGRFQDASVTSGLGSPSWQFTAFGTGWLDLDNDGWLDLVAVNGAVKVIEEQLRKGDPYPLKQRNQVFRNQGRGRFEEVTARAGSGFVHEEVSRGLIQGDLDNDGDTDLVLVNNSGPARLLRNDRGQDAHWIGLRLVAGQPARDQLGARVGVKRAGQPTIWRTARTDGSFVSANDPRVLVGLGDDRAVTAVEVRWPDGVVETFTGLAADRYHTLTRGAGARP